MAGEDWDGNEFEGEFGEDSEDDSAIQAILDHGYDQLDGFVNWLEEHLGLDTRIAQQDTFNAETLIDYLANQSRKNAEHINEFDLRWFLFSHYIRHAMAEAETEERLLDSVRRFYSYLETEQGYLAPEWLHTTLDERPFYLARRAAYAELDNVDEKAWQQGFRAWNTELEDDLDARVLWLPRDMEQGMQWGDVMGWREATLQEEANRLWQEERQSLLNEGRDYESVRLQLLDSYSYWLDAPQEKLDDNTPREIIVEERNARIDAGDEEDEEDEDE